MDTEGGRRLDFKWKLVPAAAAAEGRGYLHYGLMLAATAGIPEDVLAEASRWDAV